MSQQTTAVPAAQTTGRFQEGLVAVMFSPAEDVHGDSEHVEDEISYLPTVAETGFQYPAHVDFSEGVTGEDGTFYPRYIGYLGPASWTDICRDIALGKTAPWNGSIYDTKTGRQVYALNPPNKAGRSRGMLDDPEHAAKEEAFSNKP